MQQSPEELKDALRLDAWTWTEALCWLKGRGYDKSRAHFLPTHYPDEADQIQRAIKAGKLTVDSSTPRQWL